eukprot:Pgem_evm1s6815
MSSRSSISSASSSSRPSSIAKKINSHHPTFKQKFDIINYHEISERLTLPEFNAFDRLWRLVVRPQNDLTYHGGLYLQMISGDPVRAEFKFNVFDNIGGKLLDSSGEHRFIEVHHPPITLMPSLSLTLV